jgi:hypothetical protein
VHAVAAVSGPESWKLPTWKEVLLSCPQQSCNVEVASPAVPVPKSKTRNGEEDAATRKEMPL